MAAATEVKVGWLSEIVMWNPMNIEMVEDYVACYLMFSCLFTYDQDLNLEYDLATGVSQVVNPDDTMTTTIDITSNAYFRNAADPTDTTHPLTAYDVAYTYNRIMANPGGAWDTYLYNVSSVTVISDTRLEIVTDFAKATLLDDLMGIPIIPEYMWSSIADNKFLTAKAPDWLVGSGPFYFNASTATWYRFTTAPNYHGATDYPGARDVNIGSILYTVYGDPGALALAMNSGVEDTIALLGQPNLFVNTLGVGATVNVVKQAVQENGICDIAINAIPLDFRTHTYATGNPLLLDYWVRDAIAMTLNKVSIDNDLMLGLVTQADSVVQPGYWHKDISPEVPYDPPGAMALLQAHGYSDTDSDGYLEATATAYPVMQGWADVGDELSFRVHAPNNAPEYMSIGENWVAWAADAGIRFNYAALSESLMINKDWYKADYDIWVWHWGWGPEPLGSALSVWLTEEIAPGSDNCQMPMGPWYYTDLNSSTGVAYSAYDENFTLALKTLDQADRKVIVDKLQQWIYDSRCELPPFYDLGLYAYTDQRFVGWGDWEAHVGRSICSDLLWLWFDLEGRANVGPIFNTPLNAQYGAVVGQTVTFQVEVSDADGDPLILNWTFGDGSPVEQTTLTTGTATPTLVTKTHVYMAENLDPGYPVLVTVWDYQSGHQKQSTSVVYVSPEPDSPPRFTSPVGYSPAPPQYTGTTVTWWANATDDESGGGGYGLQFTWAWGDGTTTVSNHVGFVNGSTVTDMQTHSWSTSGIKTVIVYIWDGRIDPTHNVSSSTPYEIIVDQAPASPSISAISGLEDTWIECRATSSDPDPFTLRFTWEWDDGTFNVTNHANPMPGSTITSIVHHMWPAAGLYPVTVFVDDLHGHNLSSSATADITSANVAPSAPAIVVTPANPADRLVGATITFNSSAIDADGDAMAVYITFGDGDTATDTTPGGTTARQYVDPPFTHVYSSAATYTVMAYFNDGNGHNVSTSTSVTILEDQPPAAPTISPISGLEDTWIECRASSSDVNPGDLKFTWVWGDGTYNVTTHANPVPGSTITDVVYHRWNNPGSFPVTVHVEDPYGHNVSSTVNANIASSNVAPSSPSLVVYPTNPALRLVGSTITFNASAIDADSDAMDVYVAFGDGTGATDTTPGGTSARQYVDPPFAHVYGSSGGYTVDVYFNDGNGHNVSTSTTVTILDDEPPAVPTISAISGVVDVWIECIASSSDVNPGDLKFTWEWDDGTYNVTTHANPTPGSTITDVVYHMWTTVGSFPVTVYVEDSYGHNISATIMADIVSGNVGPSAPAIAVLPVDPALRLEGTTITFNASAIDADGDAMAVYITYGDGTGDTDTTPGGVTTRQYVDPPFTHVYSAAASYTVTVYFDDGNGHNVSVSTMVVILADLPPATPSIPPISGQPGNWIECRASSSDSNPGDLKFTWEWDDGSYNVTVLANPVPGSTLTDIVHHLWPSAGSYLVTVYVEDPFGHNVSASVTADIVSTNVAPSSLSVIVLPSDPAERLIGTTITFNASAIDGDGDEMDVYIDYGDGTGDTGTTAGGVPTRQYVDPPFAHAFSSAATYTVTVFFNDRNGHNVSVAVGVTILEDQPPSTPVISSISGLTGAWLECTVTSSDPNPGTLKFTWAWDDGSFNVTEYVNSIPGATVTDTVHHLWPSAGLWPVTVYVEDSYGHNVSASTTATITSANVAPTSLDIAISPADPAARIVGTDLTFDPSAIDADGDALSIYVEFGDGATVTGTTLGGTTSRQHLDSLLTHAYAVEGLYTVTAYFEDGNGHNVSMSADVEILPLSVNEPPWLEIQANYGAKWNVPLTVTPTHAQDNDTDELKVWFDWGDGTALTEGDAGAYYAGTHTYMTLGDKTLTVWANDTTGGHNVSMSATVRVTDNLKPSFVGGITKVPSKAEYNESETVTIRVVVKDYEGDMINLTVEFGDGTVAYREFVPAANTNVTQEFSHIYLNAKIDPYAVNVTAKDNKTHYSMLWERTTTTVKVVEPSVEPPPGDGDEGAFPWAIVGIGIIAIVIIALVALLLMKRKKGGAEQKGGMEGMAPPEVPPPPPQ